MPERKPAEDAGSTVAKALARIIGALGALVAFVYISGGGILWLRLTDLDLPAASVIGYLPRDFLISVGLREVVVPLIGIAAGIAIIVALFLSKPIETLRRRLPGDPELIGFYTFSILPFVIGGYGVYQAVIGEVASAILLMTGGAFVYVGWWFIGVLRGPLAQRFDVEALIVFGVMASAVAALPFAIFFAHVRWTPQIVLACEKGGRAVEGIFVGETADRIYLGVRGSGSSEREFVESPYIVSISKDEAIRLYLGEDLSQLIDTQEPCRSR